jgi:NADH dehydrogenase
MSLALEAPRPRVLILGAGYAGVLAAIRIARKARRAQVTLVNDQPHFVERIRLHQLAVGQKLPMRPIEKLLRGTGATLLLGRITGVTPADKLVDVETSDGRKTLAYDVLVYALGSGRVAAKVPGVAEHAYDVASEASATRLAAALGRLGARGRVTIVGGGLTGIELATELAEARRDLRVTLVSTGVVAEGLSTAGRRAAREALDELGVSMREDARVVHLGPHEVTLADGERLPSDVTVWCGGFGANPLAASTGLPCTPSGRLALDPYLRSVGAPDVFGAGDGAAIASTEASHVRMACATAMPLGAHVADNVVRTIEGAAVEPFGFAFFAQCVSLGRKRGIFQRVAPDDTPLDSVVTGRLGARLKEAVCKYTTTMFAIERLLAGTYTWPGRGKPVVSGSTPDALPASIG